MIQIDKVTPKHESLSDNYQALRIAQVAAPWVSVPPKDYGETELVISNLTEELIKQQNTEHRTQWSE
jgi:hypothetical protein